MVKWARQMIIEKIRRYPDWCFPLTFINLNYRNKFLNREELKAVDDQWSMNNGQLRPLTLLWSCKEAVFKWYGDGNVDFRQHIQLQNQHKEKETIDCYFAKSNQQLIIHYRQFDGLVMAWTVS